MENSKLFNDIADFQSKNSTIHDKTMLSDLFKKRFKLTQDRKIFYNSDFAIRFSKSRTESFSNTVLSLSALRKYDNKPFFVCLVTPIHNIIYLANSSFLKKISHSSQQLRIDNIKGSFNGTDILREISGIENKIENFNELFNIHTNTEFNENLVHLVENTNNISPSGHKFIPNASQKRNILNSIDRTIDFINSQYFMQLQNDLITRTQERKDIILTASKIKDVKTRGMVTEYLITTNDIIQAKELVKCGFSDEMPHLPNGLADYTTTYPGFHVGVDIKTKVLVFDSAPKAYNIDKMLEFLSENNTVFLFFFVGTDFSQERILNKLIPIFDNDLLETTRIQLHWSGRNSRGTAQFDGFTIDNILNENHQISFNKKKINDTLEE
jgi:hypothetical protein